MRKRGMKQRAKRWWQTLRETVHLMGEHRGHRMAAGIAYFTAFALAPLLRITRAAMLTALRSDPVRGARAGAGRGRPAGAAARSGRRNALPSPPPQPAPRKEA